MSTISLIQRLAAQRGDRTTFFVLRRHGRRPQFQGQQLEAHGWMGIRFQTTFATRTGPASEVILHVRMWDRENVLRRSSASALGIIEDQRGLRRLLLPKGSGAADPFAFWTTWAPTASRSTCSSSAARPSRAWTTG